MDAANKPDRGPVQRGRHPQTRAPTSPPRSVPQSQIIPGGGSRPHPGDGGEWAAVPARRPARSDLERAVAEAAGRSTPTDDNEAEDRRLWWRVVALILMRLVLVWAASWLGTVGPARGSEAITDR
jgi:hypothetical protein